MLTLDNVPLDDPSGRWYVLATSKVRNPPAVVVNDLTVPGQHGVISPGLRPYGPGTVILTMRVYGGSYTGMMANYSALSFYLGIRKATRTLLDTELSQAAGVQLVSISDLEQNTREMATCTVTFSIPRSFWRDAADTTVDLGTAAGVPSAGILANTNAPIVDPVFVIGGNGAGTDFQVTDGASLAYFRLVGNVPAGQSARIEPDLASAYLVPTATPWTGGTDISGMLTIGPGQFSLSPGVSFVIAKSGTTNTQMRARRAYL